MNIVTKLLVIAVSIFGLASLGNEEVFSEPYTFSEDKAAKIENLLSWTAYNPQGEAKDGKIIYVFGALGCPYTRQVMERSGEIDGDMQIRWIFPQGNLTPRLTGFMTTEPMPQAYRDAMAGKKEADTKLQKMIYDHNSFIFREFGDALGGPVGYPMIIYKNGDALKMAAFIDDVIAEKDNISPMKDRGDKAREYLAKALDAESGKIVKGENKSKKKFMHSYILPDTESPSLDAFNFGLQPGYHTYGTCKDFGKFFMCRNNSSDRTLFFLAKN